MLRRFDVTKDNRDFLWDFNIDFQHEIMRGLSFERRLQPQLGRQLHGHRAHGLRSTRTSYDEFCITVPNDARLPNAGQQQCGFYDIKPELFGQGTLRVTNAKEFVGKNGNTRLPQRYWDGFWVSADGRLPRNSRLGGGIDVGRNVDDHCFTVDVPNQPVDITGTGRSEHRWNAPSSTRRARARATSVTSWMDNLDFRINGSMPIKGGFTAASSSATRGRRVERVSRAVTAANVTFKNGRAA